MRVLRTWHHCKVNIGQRAYGFDAVGCVCRVVVISVCNNQVVFGRPEQRYLMMCEVGSGEPVSLPEWSKGLRSGRNVFERVGSNPTADISSFCETLQQRQATVTTVRLSSAIVDQHATQLNICSTTLATC